MSKNKTTDVEGMVIGGSTLMGLGVGFIFLDESALVFVAAILIGIGFGLFATIFVPKK